MKKEVSEHYILNAYYGFHSAKLTIIAPLHIVKETEYFYYTDSKDRFAKRFAKKDIGTVALKSTTAYPYVEIVLLDGTEDEAREVLADWFIKMSKTMLTRPEV